MLPLFAAAIFVSAALLFVIEPLAGKIYLPLLGGSPAVWNTCVVFFQGVLLLGYLYAHLTTRYLKPRAQAILHVLLLAGAAALLPVPIAVGEPGSHQPVLWLIAKLGVTMGLPFFVISATGPLLQRWFSHTAHTAARDPYFLYAASNAGSVLGLLAYPLALEPLLTRQQQSRAWALGYIAMTVFILGCAWVAATRRNAPVSNPQSEIANAKSPAPTWPRRLRWIILALVPSSLMLGVTQHISTDIAAVPLLWIGPLLLYLLSFIVAFSPRIKLPAAYWGYLLPFLMIVLLMVMLSQARGPLPLLIPQHFITFFIAATMCHRLLAEDRPDPAHLTEFYFLISLGGVLGGCFNALIAPNIFHSILEYPIMLGVVCLLRPQVWTELRGIAPQVFAKKRQPSANAKPQKPVIQLLVAIGAASLLAAALWGIDREARAGRIAYGPVSEWIRNLRMFRGQLDPQVLVTATRAALPAVIAAAFLVHRGSLRFALAALTLFIGSQWIGAEGRVLCRERSFFGVYTIYTGVSDTATWHVLNHGTTQHGIQFFPTPAENPTPQSLRLAHLPTTYYHPRGPIGDVIGELSKSKRFDDAAFIGLGAGTLAAYGQPGTRMTFFDIDPLVRDLATDPRYFTYVSDARAKGADVEIVIADGRLGIAASPRGPFHLIVVDAFSSDAIPIHLITREALAVYLSRLRDDGIIAFHISNRSFNLAPVLARLAEQAEVHAYLWRDVLDIASEGKRESHWVAIARDPKDLGDIANNPDWVKLKAKPGDPLWTDDYSNILSVLGGS